MASRVFTRDKMTAYFTAELQIVVDGSSVGLERESHSDKSSPLPPGSEVRSANTISEGCPGSLLAASPGTTKLGPELTGDSRTPRHHFLLCLHTQPLLQ